MMHQLRGFRDRHLAPLLILVLLVLGSQSKAQVYQRLPNRYEYRAGWFDSTLRIPFGTAPKLNEAIQTTTPGAIFYNTVDSSVYIYTGSAWKKIGGGSDNILWGNIVGSITSQPDLVAKLGEYQPLLATGTTAQYLRGDGSLSSFSTDVKAIGDARYAIKIHNHLFSQLTDGVSAVRNLFSAGGGLSYNPSTGVFSALDTLDPASYALIAQLNDSMTTVRDSLAAIRNAIGTGGSGPTPTLQLVTDAGSYTTNAIKAHESIQVKPNNDYPAAGLGWDTGTDGTPWGWLQLKGPTFAGGSVFLKPVDLGGIPRTQYLPNESDTLATRGWVKSVSGPTPTLQTTTDAGNTTTNNIFIVDGTNNGLAGLQVVGGNGTMVVANSTYSQARFKWDRITNPYNHDLMFPIGVGTDTLATLANVRAGSGTSSNFANTNLTFTGYRAHQLGAYNLKLERGAFGDANYSVYAFSGGMLQLDNKAAANHYTQIRSAPNASGGDYITFDVQDGTKYTGINMNGSYVAIQSALVKLQGKVNMPTLPPDYADNAAAIAAGLSYGDIYRTGDLLKIVH